MALASQVLGGWGIEGSFLPLNQPLLQLPMMRSRAIRTGFPTANNEAQSSLDQHSLSSSYTLDQLQQLISRHSSYTTANQRRQQRRHSTTTTTTTTTPRPTSQRRLRKTQTPRFVSQFHYGSLEGREEYAVSPSEDDAIVLLVGLFNLLAVVVYAANKYIKGEPGGLSERVIQWQVQKVLDELVIKVHSSQYAANLLSRAMPDDVAVVEVGRAVHCETPPWLNLLQTKLQSLMIHNTSGDTTKWLQQAKQRLMTEIGSSPAALATELLHPRIYEPLQELYATLTTEGGAARALQEVLGGDEGRGLPSHMNDLPSLLSTLSKLSLTQLQAALAALTALGRAQQRVNVVPALASALRGSLTSQNSVGEGRSDSGGDHHFSKSLVQYLQQSRVSSETNTVPYATKNSAAGNRREYNSRYSRVHKSEGQQQVRREGMVEDENSLTRKSSGHWTDRWFSLVTQVSPVGLDMSTLYARARARPACLRALLCRANNAWRQVGPVQAALTPFSSVVLSWVLEDVAPHSLGDSLIAIRAGWMGKGCTELYPECPLTPDPHPAAKEAITFFSRLQYAATQPSEQSPHLASQPNQDQTTINTLTKRTNVPDQQETTIHKNKPWPPYSPQRQDFQGTPSPHLQSQPHNRPPATNTPWPAQRYWLTESESQHLPQEYQNTDSNRNDAAASFQAYYERYEGQGPMSVPGLQYSSKYGQLDGEDSSKFSDELYEKYDSPASSSAEGTISNSSSVSGMALQDRPTSNSPKVWEKFFKAGLYGSSVQQAVTVDHKESSSEESDPAKSTLSQHPQSQPMSSLNKMGALFPQQFSHANSNNNQGHFKHSQLNRLAKPFFNVRPMQKHRQTTRAPFNPQPSSAMPAVKKYKYGLRRGLPAGNVNGHSTYTSSSNNLYRHKPWYTYNHPRYQPTSLATTSTTTSTTAHPLKLKDVAPFGPEDAVTDVLRNELLFEYIRDRQGSIPTNDK
ncbi:uncharacterized protein [Cherax quadricarinatus]|uniref:uncharacterized protein n=1 Tax=Cherax quadricarinatus TaxID=27406 RepID=UPI002379E3DB|nr:uncharacterized protein LOC128701364 [Cherax quadricarinatus]